jgi:crotonobetainyl-CoA:carnitine CoA-transferase CaiB-like acyl-CoA transferase
MALTDAGAECIVVEPPPGVRERARAAVRGKAPLEPPPGAEEQERFRAHDPLRRNKRSIAIDLKQPAGLEVVRRLADRVDVLFEGFRPGVADRLGIGYGTLAERNPRLIYASITGYGQSGPYHGAAGHDVNYIALSGQLAATGRAGTRPAIPLNVIGDIASGGLMGALAISEALFARERTGRGRYLDIAMAEGSLYLLAWHLGRVLAGQPAPGPDRGRLGGEMPYYDVYRCADGRFVALGCFDSHFWSTLCTRLGCPELITEQHSRAARPRVRAVLAERFASRGRDEWIAFMRGHDVCLTPVLELDEALEDEHFRAREMIATLDDAVVGPVRQVASPLARGDASVPGQRTAPELGQHTDEILAELGYSSGERAHLRDRSVVA